MSDTAAKANVLQALVERKKLEQAELGQKRAREELPEGEGVDLGPLDDFEDDAGPAVAGAPVNGDQAGPKEVFDDGLGKGGDGSGPAIDDEGEGDLVFREEDMDFIDDEGLADEQRVDFADDGNAPTQAEAEEAEEADDLSRMFEKGRRESTGDHAELARQAENLMAQMEAALDADREAFDHLLRGGVLGVLKGWLEPMPDGSLPNSKVRAGVLQMLVSLKINTHDEEQRDWLKRSGVGKLVMLLTKLPEETIENQRVRVDNSVSV
jgi:transcription factor SPN1